jgi:GH25 family lysozyme M1 (1,4-beta-N-acetylmuramidase)
MRLDTPSVHEVHQARIAFGIKASIEVHEDDPAIPRARRRSRKRQLAFFSYRAMTFR